jgi:hypothetical protein
LADPAYVTVILVRVEIVIILAVLFRRTQNIPTTVAAGLAFERIAKGVADVML